MEGRLLETDSGPVLDRAAPGPGPVRARLPLRLQQPGNRGTGLRREREAPGHAASRHPLAARAALHGPDRGGAEGMEHRLWTGV